VSYADTVRLVREGVPSYNTLMDVSHLLEGLNDAQRAAVSAPLAPSLTALPGSFKWKARHLTAFWP
jgi:hypothetical protein